MNLLYTVFFSIYIAIGASCTNDAAQVQRLLNKFETVDFVNFFEPVTSLVLVAIKSFSPLAGVAYLHLISTIILINSFHFYFVKTKIINHKMFYLITFISILNPFTFELVGNNTRQYFFISLASIPIYYLVVSYLDKFLLPFSNYRKNCLKNRFIPIIFLILSLGSHSTSPVLFLFGLLFYIIYLLIKFLPKFSLKISIPRAFYKLNINYIYILLFSFIPISYIFYKILIRIFYVFILYSPTLSWKGYVERGFGFDTGSIVLISSSLFTVSVFYYLAYKLPSKLFVPKAFTITTFLYPVLIFCLAALFPTYQVYFRRIYAPIVLVSLPIVLVLISSIFKTKFLQFIISTFLIISLAFQFLKLSSAQTSTGTFFSLNNKLDGACAIIR